MEGKSIFIHLFFPSVTPFVWRAQRGSVVLEVVEGGTQRPANSKTLDLITHLEKRSRFFFYLHVAQDFLESFLMRGSFQTGY